MSETTPEKVGLSIKKILRLTKLKEKPIYLPFISTSPDYKARFCLTNCEKEEQKRNCTIISGWVVWQSKEDCFIEAEFHTVIKIQSTLIDVTPRIDGENLVLFVPDKKHHPKRIDSKTWQTWSNIKSIRGTIIEITKSILIEDITINA